MTTHKDLEDARSALQTGQRKVAGKILAGIVRNDPKNGEAWHLLSLVVDKTEDQEHCKKLAHRFGYTVPLPIEQGNLIQDSNSNNEFIENEDIVQKRQIFLRRDNNRSISVGCGFYLKWILATGIGWIMGFVLSFTIYGIVDITVFRNLSFLFRIIPGISSGIAQYFILRRYAPKTSTWILATFIGIVIGYFENWFITNSVCDVMSCINIAIPIGSIIGIIVGFAQWLVLRKQIPNPSWWMFANIVGWTLGWAISEDLLAGVVAGIFTGIALAWFLRRSIPIKPMYVKWIFCFQWLLASIIGWEAGWVIGVSILGINNLALLLGLIGFVCIMQTIILKPILVDVQWASWASAVIVGLIVSWVLDYGLGVFMSDYNFAIKVAIIGASVSIRQGFILRRLQIDRANWWIVVSTVAWTVGWIASGVNVEPIPVPTIVGTTLAYPILDFTAILQKMTIGGVVFGIITVMPLVPLLRQSIASLHNNQYSVG